MYVACSDKQLTKNTIYIEIFRILFYFIRFFFRAGRTRAKKLRNKKRMSKYLPRWDFVSVIEKIIENLQMIAFGLCTSQVIPVMYSVPFARTMPVNFWFIHTALLFFCSVFIVSLPENRFLHIDFVVHRRTVFHLPWFSTRTPNKTYKPRRSILNGTFFLCESAFRFNLSLGFLRYVCFTRWTSLPSTSFL